MHLWNSPREFLREGDFVKLSKKKYPHNEK